MEEEEYDGFQKINVEAFLGVIRLEEALFLVVVDDS